MTEQISTPMSQSIGYTIETCKTTIKMLDEARQAVRAHPDMYDVESTIADLDARIKKWSMRYTELMLKA